MDYVEITAWSPSSLFIVGLLMVMFGCFAIIVIARIGAGGRFWIPVTSAGLVVLGVILGCVGIATSPSPDSVDEEAKAALGEHLAAELTAAQFDELEYPAERPDRIGTFGSTVIRSEDGDLVTATLWWDGDQLQVSLDPYEQPAGEVVDGR